MTSNPTASSKGRRNTRLRFEQFARNPNCPANVTSAILGVPMSEVASREGLTPNTGQSPFAVARGVQFERELFRKEAERLRQALVEEKVLSASAGGFLELRLRQNGGSCANLDVARDKTEALLRSLARPAGRKAAPSLVAGATLRLPGGMMLPETMLALDVLVLVRREDHTQLIVGEIKTYPDRGGHTDRGELATARAQAGMYVHALRVMVREWGLEDAIRVSTEGFLVLTRPGSNLPRVRAREDFRYQAERARRGFERLRERAEALAGGLEGAPEDAVEAVLAEPCVYTASCVSFCDRASGCFQRALEVGDPAVLGEGMRRFLGGLELHRAAELVAGKARPRNPAEQALVARIAELRQQEVL